VCKGSRERRAQKKGASTKLMVRRTKAQIEQSRVKMSASLILLLTVGSIQREIYWLKNNRENGGVKIAFTNNKVGRLAFACAAVNNKGLW